MAMFYNTVFLIPINIFVQKNSFFAFFEIQFFILQVVIMSMIILVQKIKLMPKNMEQKTKARKLLIWVRFRWTWLSFIETSVVYLGCITDAYTTTSECYSVLFGVIRCNLSYLSKIFFKIAKVCWGPQTWDLLVSFYFLSHMQRLRPLGSCTPLMPR